MVFNSVADLTAALAGIATISGDRITRVGRGRRPRLVDRLAHTAALGGSPEVKGTARWVILHLAAAHGRALRLRSTTSTWRWAAARPAASRCRPSTCGPWPTTPAGR